MGTMDDWISSWANCDLRPVRRAALKFHLGHTDIEVSMGLKPRMRIKAGAKNLGSHLEPRI